MREQHFQTINDTVAKNMEEMKQLRDYLYENPEISAEEEKAVAYITTCLGNHGFAITKEFYGIPTAFKAEVKAEKAGPTIGICCEYDAMPETGHSCGHNIIAAASVSTGLALQSIVEETGGKIIVYGTPGEESLGGKALLSRMNAFDECDVMMMAHPAPVSQASCPTLAVECPQIEFFGKTAHAGVEPEKGINALDAAVMCYSSISQHKQYYKNTNIYGVINEGGVKATAIPDYTRLTYVLRAPKLADLKAIVNMVYRCAEAAATITGCTYKIVNFEETYADMVTNETLSSVFNRHYEDLTGEVLFVKSTGGSTDMGDVSYQIPAIHPWLGLNCPDISLHNSAFVPMTISKEGDRFIEMGSKGLAYTAYDVLTNPELLAEIKKEFAAMEK